MFKDFLFNAYYKSSMLLKLIVRRVFSSFRSSEATRATSATGAIKRGQMLGWLKMIGCFSPWWCVRCPCCCAERCGVCIRVHKSEKDTAEAIYSSPAVDPFQLVKTHAHSLAKHIPNTETNRLIILSAPQARKPLFSRYEVNRAPDSRVVESVSFVPWPLRRGIWPLPSSNFRHHIQIRRPAVSLIRTNVLNHLSRGFSPACAPSLSYHQHLNVAPVIAVAGGNTLRDWGDRLCRAESTFSYLC